MGRRESGATAPVMDSDSQVPDRNRPRIVLEGTVLWVAIAVVLIVALGPWVYLAWAIQTTTDNGTGERSTRLVPVRSNALEESTGAWGNLSSFDIVIAPPLEFVQSISDSQASLDWRMRNTTREQFAQMLAHLPLDEPTRVELMNMARPDAAGTDLVLTPNDEFILKLTPEVRGALYHALALDTINEVQTNAFRFNGSLDEWFADSGVSDATMELLQKLAYPYKGSTFLADMHVLLPRLSKAEQMRVLKAASGQRTLSLALRVTADDNIAELTHYWGRGRRSKDVRPLLESLAKIKGGGTIDVAHLLPGFARSRLYTYPTPSMSEGTRLQNCHWTAFNFFSQTPDDRFTDLQEALDELKANYYPIYRNPALGDLVVFSDAADPMFHVAVYVADDVVFTKNGITFSLPWMYMRLDQMQEFYARPLQVNVTYYRHKSL